MYDRFGGAAPPSPPYYEGRWTNGPVWVEYLASELGLPEPIASSKGGKNYAWGGAQTGDGTSTRMPGYGIPNLGPQIHEFLSTGERLTENDLIVVWAGGNDLAVGIDPAVTVSNLSDHITLLHDNGGRNFLLRKYDGELGTLMAEGLSDLGNNLPASITLFDYEVVKAEVLANPIAFGFTNVSEPACRDCGIGINFGANDVVPNPDEYRKWDNAHSTTAFHRIIGERAAEAVAAIPEPSTLVLALIASLALLASPRRRRLPTIAR